MRIATALCAALMLVAAGNASAQPGPNGNNNYGLCKAYFAGSPEGRENKAQATPFQVLFGIAEAVAVAQCQAGCGDQRTQCDNGCAQDEQACLDDGGSAEDCADARETCEQGCATAEQQCNDECEGTCEGDGGDDCVEDWCQENGQHPVHEDKNPGRDTASPGQQKKQNGGNGENGDNGENGGEE